MAASPFMPQQQAFRPAASTQSPFTPLPIGTTTHAFDRDHSLPVGASFGSSTPMMTSVQIRGLPAGTTQDELRLILTFSEDVVDVLVGSSDEDLSSSRALLKFKSLAGALEAKNALDGKQNMTVEILDNPHANPGTRRYPNDAPIAPPASAGTSTASSATSSRQPSRFAGNAFGPLETTAPSSNGLYGTSNELGAPESNNRFAGIFSPTSPIGNHLAPRMLGKTLINTDGADDDVETKELLNNPVAFAAEHGAYPVPQARRSTAPHIPVTRLDSLSLNTNGYAAPFRPGVMGPLSAHDNTMPSFMAASQQNQQGYQRVNMPPINPADQNPPCNTLYVGNLPANTNEEELKILFMRQRGYRRLCFRTKQNGPMCFVEFDDVSNATRALSTCYGHTLANSTKGGIRLSFSKNPLGVRSGQNPMMGGAGGPGGLGGGGSLASMNGMMANPGTVFGAANGPPPGLPAPPGLNLPPLTATRSTPTTYAQLGTASLSTVLGNNGNMASGIPNGYGSSFAPTSTLWNTPSYSSSMTAGGPSAVTNGAANGFNSYMTSR